MKVSLLKILLILFFLSIVSSCNVVKRVGENELLLTGTSVTVNDKKNNKEAINNLLYQKPNAKALGIPLRLHIYNLARPNRDSLFEIWLDKNPKRRERLNKVYSQKQVNKLKESSLGFNNWLKKTGEAPTIIDTVKTNKSIKRLEDYYFANGWFDRSVSYKITENENRRATLDFNVQTGKPYLLDSITETISSPVIDSLFEVTKSKSIIKSGRQFNVAEFDLERNRLTSNFRNSGVFFFTQDYIRFDIDTIVSNRKVDVAIKI